MAYTLLDIHEKPSADTLEKITAIDGVVRIRLIP